MYEIKTNGKVVGNYDNETTAYGVLATQQSEKLARVVEMNEIGSDGIFKTRRPMHKITR